MASLVLAAVVILLIIIFIGPITYLFSKLHFPKSIIYTFSTFCILSGIWFGLTLPHIFYIGFIPIYFGYISIKQVNKDTRAQTQLKENAP